MIPEIEADVEAATWGLNRIGADQRGRAGAGATVFVLDTGVRVTHQEFANNRAAPALDMTVGSPKEGNGDMSCAADRGRWCHSVGHTSCGTGAMRAVALSVCGATHVAIALLGAADRHVQSRRGPVVGELLVRHPHASVEHKDRGTSSRPATLVCPDPVQAPSCCLHISLNLGDHRDLAVWLNILDCASTAVDNRLQIALGAAHLNEGDTSGRVPDKVTSVPVHLAHALNL